MHGTTEVHLHALVDALALAVSLGVVRGGVEQLSACSSEQFSPEVAGEDLVVIGDDGGGNAVQLDNVVPERSSHLLSLKRVSQRDEVGELGEAIDNNHDGVESLGNGQSLYEVHGQILPGNRWHGQGCQESGRLGALVLGLLASHALLHEFVDVPLHPAPVEVLAHSLVGRCRTRVATHRAVV